MHLCAPTQEMEQHLCAPTQDPEEMKDLELKGGINEQPIIAGRWKSNRAYGLSNMLHPVPSPFPG